MDDSIANHGNSHFNVSDCRQSPESLYKGLRSTIQVQRTKKWPDGISQYGTPDKWVRNPTERESMSMGCRKFYVVRIFHKTHMHRTSTVSHRELEFL